MSETPVPVERIRQMILLLRGQKVILDRDLAALYGVPTKALKQAVKRNAGRFPEDFMFVLTPAEIAEWRSHFVTSKADRMGLRHPPMAFTEQGIAMLSSVLHSERAVQVNIEIMRPSSGSARRRCPSSTPIIGGRVLNPQSSIRNPKLPPCQLMAPPERPRRSIGFRVEERRPRYGRRRQKGASACPHDDEHSLSLSDVPIAQVGSVRRLWN
jgi:hypothetical protein